jgi:hypothetical protein
MRVRPARDLPCALFNPTVFLVNLFPSHHDQHSIEVTALQALQNRADDKQARFPAEITVHQ